MPRRFLFRLFAALPTSDHVSDRELLRRFVSSRDAAAFELLVRRHADAVWAAALRILGNEADAEDAFQAAFLALLRKAASVRGACAGAWLHRVAVNAALKLKAGRTPTATEEVGLAEHPVADAPDLPERAELAALVHQELARLPDRYRLPVVLCDLEGQSHADAAKALGWPVGSVSGRLSRARDILRERLARRGLAAPAALFAAAVAPSSATSTAIAIATGTLAASSAVNSLTEGVLSAMRTAKLKLTAAVLAAAGLVGLGAAGTVLALTQVPAPRTAGEPPLKAEQPPPKADPEPKKDEDFTAFPDLKPPVVQKDEDYPVALKKLCPRLFGDAPPAEPGDDTYRKLLKARLQQDRLDLQSVIEVIRRGGWDRTYHSQVIECMRDIRGVAVELWGRDQKTLIPWLEESVIMEKEIERFMGALVKAGRNPPQDIHTARRHRLEAEAVLWKAKQQP